MGTTNAAMYGGVRPWPLGQRRPRPGLPKPVQLDINHDDDLLFNASFSPRVALTYQCHVKDMRKMVRQQGEGFWVRFVASLRSHAERRRLMDGVPFGRAEAVFIDMLRMLTCRDGLEELSRLVSSLRAMHAVIAANDYPVLLDPVLRALMTCYDKPLEGLRLYFRFVSALVALFRRWRTALAAARYPAPAHAPASLPWQPPPHWQEGGSIGGGGGEWSESTFEGHLLAKYGAHALPRLLGLRPAWLPAPPRAAAAAATTAPMRAHAQEEEEVAPPGVGSGVGVGVGAGVAMAKRGRRKSRRRRSVRSAYASASRGRRGREADGSDGECARCDLCLMGGHHFGPPFGEDAFLRNLHKCSGPPLDALHQSSQFVMWSDGCSMDELCDQRLETSSAENNARLMLEMSGMHPPYYPMEGMLPLPWMGHEGTLLHPPPVGFYDPALIGFIPPPLPQPPSSQMRRNGQQNRYFHQRRERNMTYPELKKDNEVSHFERRPRGPDVCPMIQRQSRRGVSSCRNQWQRKEKINRDVVVYSKQVLQDEASRVFTSDRTPSPYPANGICSNDYVAAVGAALGKELATLVQTRKQERGESQKHEHLDIKSASSLSPCDKFNLKRIKTQFANENENGIGKSVQTISAKDGKEFGMMRKSLMKTEGNKMPYHYFGRAKNVRGKFFDGTNTSNSSKMIKPNQTTDCSMVAFQGRNKNFTKSSKQDVKAVEKRKRWKNVWTRRRNGEDTQLMNEKTSEEIIKDSDQNYQHYLSRRDCISGNVPDILKQVDNCELKNFWKMNDEAPKPQRKSRAQKREPKGRQEIQTAPFPRGSHSSSRLEQKITPVVMLDIVPAREPEEKDSKPQHLVARTLSQPQIFHSAEKRTFGVTRRSQSTARSVSGVGWYEEMLAEDKNKEMEETVAPFEGRCDSTGAKRNKVRKWKRKKYNQRAKAEDEGNCNGPKNDQYALRSKNIESKFLMSKLTMKENKCEVLNDSDNCVVLTNGFPTGLTTAVEVRKNVWEDSGQLKEMHFPSNENVNKSLIDFETSHLQNFTKHLLSKITETQIFKGALFIADTRPETEIQSKDKKNHQFILEEIHKIPEEIPETIRLVQNFNLLSGCLGMNRFESIAVEKIQMTVCKNIMCKNPETDSQRKRQEILAKVLKCLAGYKMYASIPTKRNVARYLFTNSERLKAIDNVKNEGADVKDANT